MTERKVKKALMILKCIVLAILWLIGATFFVVN
jgi:hypothetical protein